MQLRDEVLGKRVFELGQLLQDHGVDVQSAAMLRLICSVWDETPGSSAVRQSAELLAAAWLSTARHCKPEPLSSREHSPSFFSPSYRPERRRKLPVTY